MSEERMGGEKRKVRGRWLNSLSKFAAAFFAWETGRRL